MTAPKKHGMAKGSCALIFVILCWSALLLIGNSLYSGIKEQDVLGFPNPGQLKMYVLFPAAMVIGNVLLLAFSKKTPRALTVSLAVVQFLPAIALFLLFGGGL